MTASPDNTASPELLAERDDLLAELEDLADPRVLAVNQKHGDDHAVNLTKLRAVAKRVKTRPELSALLWESGDTAARLLAILICRPKQLTGQQLDDILREARVPKVQDWLISSVVKKSPHREQLREAWFADPDPVVASAAWALTTDAIVKGADGKDAAQPDLPELLDLIEAQMQEAPPRLQWAMNETLATIGIEHPRCGSGPSPSASGSRC